MLARGRKTARFQKSKGALKLAQCAGGFSGALPKKRRLAAARNGPGYN
jgi:hypothetical protein